MRAVFDAAAAKVEEAGAVLAGGHTIRDDEPKYGLAVVGMAHPDAIWRKNGARPGDASLPDEAARHGSRAHRRAQAGPAAKRSSQAAAAPMTELNDRAAEALRPFEPSAVTDVTGFGLFGHAHEMAERSGVRILLEPAAFPALPGALAVARAGAPHGRRPAQPRVRRRRGSSWTGFPEELDILGFDPQTAGGLLVSIPAEKGAVLEAPSRAPASRSPASVGSSREAGLALA